MSTLHQQLGEWLGVRAPESEQELLNIIEHQLPTSSVRRLLTLGVSRSEIDALVIPLRTLQHRRSRREKLDRKSTRLNSSHLVISYAVFCLKKKKHAINHI